MRIDSLDLRNFRGFHEKTVRLHATRNVLVGANGAGKTAVLDALAFALSSAVASLTGWDARPPLRPDDVRSMRFERQGVVTRERQWPFAVRCTGHFADTDLAWGRAFTADGESNWQRGSTVAAAFEDDPVRIVGAALRDAVARGEDRVLPLVAYFQTDRLWGSRPVALTEVQTPGSRLRGYDDWRALDGRAQRFSAWFKTRVLVELQTREAQPALAAVRAAICACFEGCTAVDWDVNRGELLLTLADAGEVAYGHLSAGQRNLVAMLGDLAYRCVDLNPHLGEHAPRETPGVVLLDEIDLHLHPRWQRRILDDLRAVFPAVQFIVSTHSPFVVQACAAEEVIALPGPARFDLTPYRQGVEDIATWILGVDDVARSVRSRAMEDAARELLALLDRMGDGDALDEARARYLDLAARYDSDPAYLAAVQAEAALRGVKLGGATASEEPRP